MDHTLKKLTLDLSVFVKGHSKIIPDATPGPIFYPLPQEGGYYAWIPRGMRSVDRQNLIETALHCSESILHPNIYSHR